MSVAFVLLGILPEIGKRRLKDTGAYAYIGCQLSKCLRIRQTEGKTCHRHPAHRSISSRMRRRDSGDLANAIHRPVRTIHCPFLAPLSALCTTRLARDQPLAQLSKSGVGRRSATRTFAPRSEACFDKARPMPRFNQHGILNRDKHETNTPDAPPVIRIILSLFNLMSIDSILLCFGEGSCCQEIRSLVSLRWQDLAF